MKMVVLVENSSRCRLCAEHGLSVYIEYEGKTYLLDTGATALFAENAKELGIDLSKVDTAFLSHAHYDHSGGFEEFFKENDKAAVYMQETSAENCFYRTEGKDKYIGIPQYLLENYKSLIANQNLYRALWNSFRNSAVLTVLCLLICSLAGYGFEIYHTKAKDIVFTILLTAMMVPFAAIMIPMFRMFSRLKLVNTMAAFMLPSISTPFMIMMFRQASRSFPKDIIEAARMDDAGEWKIMLKVALPMCRSSLIATMMFSVIGIWNSYFWPLVMTNSDKFRPLTLYVEKLKQDAEQGLQWNLIMAGNLILVVPILIIYCFGSKQIIKAFTYNGIK